METNTCNWTQADYPRHFCLKFSKDEKRLKSKDDEWYFGYDCDPMSYKLSEVGARMIELAIFNLPIVIGRNQFWGYNIPQNESLVNAEPPSAGETYLSFRTTDEKAMKAFLGLLNDGRCWDKFTLP